MPVTRLRGVVALADAVNFGGCPVEVDADVLGLEDAAVLFRTFLSPAVGVFAADDDHGVSPVEGGGGVFAQFELGFHEMGGGIRVCLPLALAVLPRVLDDSARYCIKCEYVSALFAIWSSGSLMTLPVSLFRTLLLPFIRI